MIFLYSIGIYILSLGLKLLGFFNSKLQKGVKGRAVTFQKLKACIHPNDKTFWFHCASLGEYEQGWPVFKALLEKYPDYKVVLSFFSPSGYEIKKHTEIADVVVYLPLDTKKNAKQFLDIVQPNFTVFVKYDIWPHFLTELKKRQLKAILISAVFRANQSYFKWYGGFMKTVLFAFEQIFTQDETSKKLLKRINYNTVTVSGDTRFDRVNSQLQIDNTISFIEDFIDKKLCVVFGSTWPEDDKLFIDFINNSDASVKFIIAPHNIKPAYTTSIKSQLKVKTVSYSEGNLETLSENKVFILDTIGYLSRAYHYADMAYVGGGAGKTGLHNILEPAVFGIPIIIGKHYDKFPEAKTLIDLKGVVSVANAKDFEKAMNHFISNPSEIERIGKINSDFVNSNTGAVSKITNKILL